MGKSFKPYTGEDKYHIRVSKKIRHPTIITEVEKIGEDEYELTGYGTTTDEKKKKHSNYKKLEKNPNPNDDRDSFMSKTPIKGKGNAFSKPYGNWHITKTDEEYIDLIRDKKKR